MEKIEHNGKFYYTNKCVLRGMVISAPTYSHSANNGPDIYVFQLRVAPTGKASEIIDVYLTETRQKSITIEVGRHYEIQGQLRSKNAKVIPGKTYLDVFVMASSVTPLDHTEHLSQAKIAGVMAHGCFFERDGEGNIINCQFTLDVPKTRQSGIHQIPCILPNIINGKPLPQEVYDQLAKGAVIACSGSLHPKMYHQPASSDGRYPARDRELHLLHVESIQPLADPGAGADI